MYFYLLSSVVVKLAHTTAEAFSIWHLRSTTPPPPPLAPLRAAGAQAMPQPAAGDAGPRSPVATNHRPATRGAAAAAAASTVTETAGHSGGGAGGGGGASPPRGGRQQPEEEKKAAAAAPSGQQSSAQRGHAKSDVTEDGHSNNAPVANGVNRTARGKQSVAGHAAAKEEAAPARASRRTIQKNTGPPVDTDSETEVEAALTSKHPPSKGGGAAASTPKGGASSSPKASVSRISTSAKSSSRNASPSSPQSPQTDDSKKLSSGERVLLQMKEVIDASKMKTLDFFRRFDADGDGQITPDEFRNAVKGAGINLTEKETQVLFRALDKDQSGALSMSRELCRAVCSAERKVKVPLTVARNHTPRRPPGPADSPWCRIGPPPASSRPTNQIISPSRRKAMRSDYSSSSESDVEQRPPASSSPVQELRKLVRNTFKTPLAMCKALVMEKGTRLTFPQLVEALNKSRIQWTSVCSENSLKNIFKGLDTEGSGALTLEDVFFTNSMPCTEEPGGDSGDLASPRRVGVTKYISPLKDNIDNTTLVLFCDWASYGNRWNNFQELFYSEDVLCGIPSRKEISKTEFVRFLRDNGFKGNAEVVYQEVKRECWNERDDALRKNMGTPDDLVSFRQVKYFECRCRAHVNSLSSNQWGSVASALVNTLRHKRGSTLRGWRLDMDIRKTGRVAHKDFTIAARNLGLSCQSKQMWAAMRPQGGVLPLDFRELDPKESALVESLCEAVEHTLNFNLKKAFQFMDRNKQRFVTFEDFCCGAARLGMSNSEEELKKIYNGLDSRGTGRVTADDFLYLDLISHCSHRQHNDCTHQRACQDLHTWMERTLKPDDSLANKLGLKNGASLSTTDVAARLTAIGYQGDALAVAKRAATELGGETVTAHSVNKLLHSTSSPGSTIVAPTTPRKVVERPPWHDDFTVQPHIGNSRKTVSMRTYFSTPERIQDFFMPPMNASCQQQQRALAREVGLQTKAGLRSPSSPTLLRGGFSPASSPHEALLNAANRALPGDDEDSLDTPPPSARDRALTAPASTLERPQSAQSSARRASGVVADKNATKAPPSPDKATGSQPHGQGAQRSPFARAVTANSVRRQMSNPTHAQDDDEVF
eukprot:TRINITY_DN120785_c0_g1_i1.p1 TRINITY_DN120785_c0_g1~~TRINITY_DN120785_c0_g1_i1.p1  ORF type:complete len:1107 (-),score=248.49 TRINITY_DN120785_c0_g1_i1:78-3398(-)